MKATKVLKYLIDNLKEAGLIHYSKDFLNYIDVSNDIVTAKQLSGFLNRDGDIQNRLFLKSVEAHFNFTKDVWNSNEVQQKKFIDDSIQNKIDLISLPNEDALDISMHIQTELPCTTEQHKLIKVFTELNTKEESEEMINTLLSTGLLERKLENQEFLVKLLLLSYDKGLYLTIIEFIIPNLYKKYYDRVEVQKCLAHTYGSLGKFDDAEQILAILLHYNTIETINLRTSALSNHKRKLFSNPSIPIDIEILYALIQGYQELHAINGIYSYYTGINLLYMVVLGQILFHDDNRFTTIDTHDIYKKSKQSLKTDKTHDGYYVIMSEYEFHLLLGNKSVLERIESFLDRDKPHTSLVERSLRQMRIFEETTKKVDNSITPLFKKSIEILNGYCEFSN